MNKLPKVELRINPDAIDTTGIDFISIVDEPAIQIKGLAFSTEEVPQAIQFAAMEDKQIIVGPVMIPEILIYRKPCAGFPDGYYAFWKEETIRACRDKFNQMSKNNNINVDHSSTRVQAFVMESWIVESKEFDKSKMYGFDLPIGTWFVAVKITDKSFWETEVKEGKCSFSVEALMFHEPTGETVEEEDIFSKLTEEDLLDLAKDLI